MITIYFDQYKINKQVLRPSDRFFFEKGKLRSEHDLMKDARAIAFDVTSGTYDSVTVEIN